MPIPTQSSTSTVAEAPRPACDQWDGRSPGSRVIAACRLPELSLADRHQWHRASARRLQLRGQPWDCIAAPVRKIRTTFPHRSFIRKRPSSSLVQRRARALSMATPAGSGAAESIRGLLSPPERCITLAPLSGARPSLGGWRVKREAGASGALPLNPGTAPATVSESRRILKSLRPRTAWEDLRRPQAFASPETGLASSSGYLRGGRIGPCCVEAALPCRLARLRRALQNPVLSPIPVRLQRLAGIPSGCGGCAR
jgi:hypothetical protein